MNVINTLIQEFPGEAAWSSFLEVFRPTWDEVEDKDYLVNEIGNEEVAIVLNAKLGSSAVDWAKQPIEAPNQKSVAQIIKDGHSGEIAVKHLIMRMPI